MDQLSLHPGSKVFYLKTPFIVPIKQFALSLEDRGEGDCTLLFTYSNILDYSLRFNP